MTMTMTMIFNITVSVLLFMTETRNTVGATIMTESGLCGRRMKRKITSVVTDTNGTINTERKLFYHHSGRSDVNNGLWIWIQDQVEVSGTRIGQSCDDDTEADFCQVT